MQIASVTGLADVDGQAGVGTTGFNLPKAAFDLFSYDVN